MMISATASELSKRFKFGQPGIIGASPRLSYALANSNACAVASVESFHRFRRGLSILLPLPWKHNGHSRRSPLVSLRHVRLSDIRNEGRLVLIYGSRIRNCRRYGFYRLKLLRKLCRSRFRRSHIWPYGCSPYSSVLRDKADVC